MDKFGFKKLKDLIDAGKTPDISQIGQDSAENLGLPWEDKEYNYRINPDHDVKYIADKNNNALGHIALDGDNVTKSVYIDPEYRGQGLGYKSHEALASKIPIQMDDANEPEIYKIWDKLKKNYPDKIEEIGETMEGKPRYGFKQTLQNLGGGKFKSLIPGIGTALGAYAALDSGDAMAAIPGLDQAENVGMSGEDERQMLAEHNARVNYDKSPAHFDKLKAMLKK